MPITPPLGIISVTEGEQFDYEFTLVDKHGRAVPKDDIDELTVVVYDKGTDEILDSWNILLFEQGATIHESNGEVVVPFRGTLQRIVNSAKDYETHVARFKAKWNEFTESKNWDRQIQVRNLHMVEIPSASLSPSSSISTSPS